MGYTFEWDRQKAESNRRKRGVTFDEASTVLGGNVKSCVSGEKGAKGFEGH